MKGKGIFMKGIIIAISIWLILVIGWLLFFFVGTFFATIGSIVMSPLFWGIVVVVLIVRYFSRKSRSN
jgi:hypothetical protein